MFPSRHAYLILAHTNPHQLALLLRLLDHPDNDIYLHIDRLARGFNLQSLRATVCHGSLSICSNYYLAWGSETMIDGMMTLLSQAAKDQHAYYHLISGMDLPLKSQSEIHAFFAKNPTLEYIDFRNVVISEELLNDRVQTYHFFQNARARNNKVIRRLDQICLQVQKFLRINRLRRHNTTFQKGSQWFSITHEFARYCVEHASQIRPYFRYSKCGDELFFQTLLLNSPFLKRRAVQTYNDNHATMRLIDWDRGNGSSPYVFRLEDYDEIMGSGMLFARKFDEQVDAEIIDRIANQVLSD